MIGEIVKVIVDRKLGTYHPKYKTLYYPINYGYVEGIIAIIHRYNDNEDKWVVANETFSKEEIKNAVYFQERYFKSVILMEEDYEPI